MNSCILLLHDHHAFKVNGTKRVLLSPFCLLVCILCSPFCSGKRRAGVFSGDGDWDF